MSISMEDILLPLDQLFYKDAVSTYFLSYYFILGLVTIILAKRITMIVRTRTESTVSIFARFVVRIPLILAAINQLQVFGELNLRWFFGLVCADYLMGLILHLAEYKALNSLDPPSILEWGATLYFSNDGDVLRDLVRIELMGILLRNVMGSVGLFYEYRFLYGFLVMVVYDLYFVKCVLEERAYPTMLFLERVPEILVFGFILFSLVVYALLLFMDPFAKKPLVLDVDLRLDMDFRLAFRRWNEIILASPVCTCFSNEMEPIKQSPFKARQKEEENSFLFSKSEPGDVLYRLKYALSLAYGVFKSIWQICQSVFTRNKTVENLVFDENEEDDPDYIPTSDVEDSESSTEDGEIEQDEPEEVDLYKELFYLAQDAQDLNLSNQLYPFERKPMKVDPRQCVVCQSAERRVVLRPCGCLCLCDHCREQLAARMTSLCPCCRRKVCGYQLIYNP